MTAPASRAAAPARSLRLVLLDLAAVGLLLLVPVIGFGPTFEGPQYLVAGLASGAVKG